MIRILLCHQHPLFRSTLRSCLEGEAGVRVIAEAGSGREALMLADYCRPDVVVLDIKLVQPAGIATARLIASKLKISGIVFVGLHADAEYVTEAFKAGARGYVLADSAPTELVHAIRVVAQGGKFVSTSLPQDSVDYGRQ
jgi:DNA-binding NarL/FixJ family response regulator